MPKQVRQVMSGQVVADLGVLVVGVVMLLDIPIPLLVVKEAIRLVKLVVVVGELVVRTVLEPLVRQRLVVLVMEE